MGGVEAGSCGRKPLRLCTLRSSGDPSVHARGFPLPPPPALGQYSTDPREASKAGTSTRQGGYTTESYQVDGGAGNVFRAGAGSPLLYLHPAAGAGIWHPYFDQLARSSELFAPDQDRKRAV